MATASAVDFKQRDLPAVKFPPAFRFKDLNNLIFSFLPIPDFVVGQRVCKAIKPDFEVWQRQSGNVDARLFKKYLGSSPQPRNLVQEIRKIARYIKRLDCNFSQFADMIQLFASDSQEPLFPVLREMSCSFYRYDESIHSQYEEARSEKYGRNRRRVEVHCPKELALQTLANLGLRCPQLTSLNLRTGGEKSEEACAALLKGIVDLKGEHRLTHLKLVSGALTDRDPKDLLDLCPRLQSFSLDARYYSSCLIPALTEIGDFVRREELSAVANHPSLRKVSIKGEWVDQASLVHLAKIPHLQHLTIEGLEVVGERRTITDLSCFSRAKELTTLELVLHGSPEDVDILKTIPFHIQKLVLTEISKVSDMDLREFERFVHLRALNLSLTSLAAETFPIQVTDKGVEALAKCQELRELSLGTRYSREKILFTTEGIINLALALPHLQQLDLRGLSGTQIDVKKIDAVLREKRSKLNVYIKETLNNE